jgi:methionyl-tRNA formyltransferase
MSLKIIFMGTPKFAVPTLEALHKSEHLLVSTYSQNPKKSNRGQKINKSEIQQCAEKLKLEVRTPEKLDDKELKYIKKINPDLVLVVAYGKIIPKQFLDIPKYGFINIHASLLPKWRGAAPIQRSIMQGEEETGITIMKINEKLDSGPILKLFSLKILPEDTFGDLQNKLSELAGNSIIPSINLIISGAKFNEQIHSEATNAEKIKKEEGKINWNDASKNIINKIRALNPSPGSFFEFKKIRYKIWRAELSLKTGKPGEVVDDKLTVATQDFAISIKEIQREGKKKLSTKEFLIGNQIPAGSFL